MMSFEVRLRSMLLGIVALRLRQTRYVATEWARIFGLVPSSGKWMERVSFVYIYVLIVALMTPPTLQGLAGLYAAEAQTAPALQATILQTTIPWIIAIISILLVINPWKAWLLRLTFGDITYLSPSPFDRRVLVLWRYLEMVLAVPLLALLPLILIAPMFGSIWASDVVPTVLRGALVISLWAAPLLALGWHISLQQYARVPLSSGVYVIARLGIIVAAGLFAAVKPDMLLWPGRLIVLVAMDKAAWAWPLFVGYMLVGIVVVWRAARHLSLTRASAGSDVFARIQQLGFMIFLDRSLLLSILSEARANERYAVGTLPPAKGLAMVFARAALYYRRQIGQAAQLFLAGIALGLMLIVWRPANLTILIITAVLLAWLVPPWLAQLFRRDLAVPFMSQFIPQPLTRRLLASSVVPTLLVLTGLLPVVFALGQWMPDWAWGLLPLIWVLALMGHVEVIGRGSAPGERNLFTVLLGALAVFVAIWTVTTSGMVGIWAIGPGLATAVGLTVTLLFFAEVRHNGFSA